MANGGIIGPVNTPTADVATGVWELEEQYQAQVGGIWPPIPAIGLNSCRFNSASNDYLTRTPSSASNRKTFTISFWVKRSSVDSSHKNVFSSGTYSSTQMTQVFFEATDELIFSDFTSSPSQNFNLTTNRKFRDPSAWYHIFIAVDTTQGTASNRIKIYVNGVRETSFSTEAYPSVNFDCAINVNQIHTIGNRNGASLFFDGYLSEFVFVDGTAQAHTDVGEFDANGFWKPIPLNISAYGTNGFRLNYENAANLGEDSSPNGNNFTVNNLTSIDQATDYPVNNYCTWNSVAAPYSAPTLSEGNTKVANNAANWQGAIGTFGVSQGKWFWEGRFDNTTNTYNHGVIDESVNFAAINPMNATGYTGFYNADGGEMKKDATDTTADYGTFGTNDIIGIALNMDDKQISIYKNGSAIVSNFALSTTSNLVFPCTVYYSSGICSYNFGNPPYAISSGNTDGNGYGNFEYAVPSGYLALNTANLSEVNS